MKKLFKLHCLSALILTLPIYVYAQGSPADLPPVQKQKYKRTICSPCEKYSNRYNELVDEMYNAQLEQRAIETSIYEDQQFISRDQQNIDSIRGKGGPNAANDLQTAYKVLHNDEEDYARHQNDLKKVEKQIETLGDKEDIQLAKLNACEKKCGAAEPRTSLVIPGSSTDHLAGWYAHVGWDFQEFSNNGTTFAESSTSKSYNVDTGYHSGFNMGIGHHFADRNSDIALDYEHLRTSDSSSAWAPSLTLQPDSLGPVSWASSSAVFHYDSVDLTAGHKIEIANNFSIYVYGGLNYTHLAKDMTVWGTGLGHSIWSRVGTSFDGGGPVFGVDGYCSPFSEYPNVNFFGGVRSSFAFGSMSGYVNTTSSGVYSADDIPKDKVVVPGIGAKAGLGYNMPYKGSTLNFQLGYKLNEYFGVTREATYSNTINSSFQGPFLNFGVGF